MKMLFTLMATALPVLGSSAQGVLNFCNKTNGLDAPVSSVGCQYALGAPFIAELFYGPAGVPECLLRPMWQLPVIDTRQYLKNGYFNMGAITIDGFLPGQTITAQVRVWNSMLGLDWEDAVRVMDEINAVGVSPLFQVNLAGLADSPANLTGLQSFCLHYPEILDPHPRLNVQVVLTNILVFSWIANAGASSLGEDNFVLQQNSSLDSRNWVTLTDVPWTDWYTKQMAIPKPAVTRFYRLISPR